MNRKEIENKITKYESFIENTLKNDLLEIQQKLEQTVSKHKEWEEVKSVLKTLKEFERNNSDMEIRIDIGEGVMASGEITDYNTTFIDIGLGCLLEMDREEAQKYCDIRMKFLQKEIDHLRKLAVEVKVTIKMTLLTINELQNTLK